MKHFGYLSVKVHVNDLSDISRQVEEEKVIFKASHAMIRLLLTQSSSGILTIYYNKEFKT
jgi:hypothetical protein